MYNKSIWDVNNKKEKSENSFFNNINCDILIIGGGITGLTTAYLLKDKGYKTILIDRSTIGNNNTTSKSTAKISFLQQDIYSKLTKMHNKSVARKYYESQKEATDIIKNIILKNNIKCDLEENDSIVFSNDETNYGKIDQEMKVLNSYGAVTNNYSDKFIKKGFIVHGTYVFNPVKYMKALKTIIKSKIKIFEDTLATNIKSYNNGYIVSTNKGTIKAKKVILACHYPFFIIPYLFPIKTYIEREYVCSVSTDTHKKISMINIDKELYSLRYYNNNLLYVSNDHRLTSKIDYEKNYNISEKKFLENFNKKPNFIWTNQDIVSNDNLPIIGTIKKDLFISTSYGAWGMTNSTIGAKIIVDLIESKENKYVELFNPKRINLPLVVNSFLGIFHYAKAYIVSIFNKPNPKYIKIKGIKYGVYKDNKGKEHKIKMICPHMKCFLIFNERDLTWDCPCHGSRFDLDGNIIETPSVKTINDD